MKNRLIFIPAAAIIFTLFLVGTFFDLQISKAIANINAFFPKAMTGFALFPLCLIIAFVGGSMIKVIMSKRYKTWYQNVLVGLFGLICICFSAYLFGKEMCSVLAFNLNAKKYLIPIGICAAIPGGISGFFLFKYVDQKDYIKKILYLTVILVIAFGIVYVMKKLAPRARYCVIANSFDTYRPWYKPDLSKEVIEGLESTTLGKEACQSFPSGHSSSAMLTLMLVNSLPLFIDKLKGKEKYLFYIGFAYYCFIALMRVYAGAHYLSDVTFSSLIALGVYFIGNEIYLRKLSNEVK